MGLESGIFDHHGGLNFDKAAGFRKMSSFRKYLGAKPSQALFVFHVLLATISSHAAPINQGDAVPARCQGGSFEIPAQFSKTVMWSILSDLDSVELVKLQKGLTAPQSDCASKIKSQVDAWLASIKSKPSADLWAFRAGYSFYTNPNKSVALNAAQEAIKLAKQEHAAGYYYKAVSLRYTQAQDITDALVATSVSKDADPFDLVLRRRAIQLLKNRLNGMALFNAAEKWTKAYPNDVDVMLTFFHAALTAKKFKVADEALRKLRAMDLASEGTSEPALRGEILNAQEKYREASVIFQSLLDDKTLSSRKRWHYQKQYLVSVVGQKKWREVRTTLDQLLLLEPTNEEYIRLFDAAIDNGGVDPVNPLADLEQALKTSPESITVKYALAKIFIKEFEYGPRLDKANLITRAETLTSQLSYAQPQSIDAAFLNAKVLFLKKVFSKAENAIRPAIEGTKKGDAKYRSSLSEIYEVAARIAWARGDWGEAKRLAREGIARIPLRADKAPLQQLLASIK